MPAVRLCSLAARRPRSRPFGTWGDALRRMPGSLQDLATSAGLHKRVRSDLLEYSDEVREALDKGLPVVALESTIISHGMPYPRNLEVALQVEQAVRLNGATPATIAIIGGQPKVGLGAADLEILARNAGGCVMKASRRDIAIAVTDKRHAATTVSSTMIVAHLAGIKVFATGGVGGVHRGAEATMDVSADLQELARTPVTVVCAGVKSILDVPKTLEYLETLGVPVITLGSDIFPAFFTNDSGLRSPIRLDSPHDVARLMCNGAMLGMGSGELVAVPNPSPADSRELQAAVEAALESASREGVSGAAVTPFVLSEVEKNTQGRSLRANVALVLNNAAVAARIAVAYAALQGAEGGSSSSGGGPIAIEGGSSSSSSSKSPEVLAVGGAVVDLIAHSGVPLSVGSSNPGTLRTSYGGVARNVAQALREEGVAVSLVTAVGDDSYGRALLAHAHDIGIDVSLSTVASADRSRTASYLAVHDSAGDLVCGVADMEVLREVRLSAAATRLAGSAGLVVIDGNVSAEAFVAVCDAVAAAPAAAPLLFFEPTSDHKCVLPLQAGLLHRLDIVKPNRSELCRMVADAIARKLLSPLQSAAAQAALASLPSRGGSQQLLLLARALHSCLRAQEPSARPKHVVATLGAEGVVWATDSSSSSDDGDAFPLSVAVLQAASPVGAAELALPLDFNGAGDAFCGGLLAALLRRGRLDRSCIEEAVVAARRRIMRNC